MTTDRFSTAEPSTAGQETHPLADAGREAGESAGHLAQRATDLGIQQADRGRETAATGIEQMADSIRRVSLDMEGDQPAIADAAQTAADQAERIARYLRETDAREIISTVEDVARRQPLVFLGGAFVLGFVAARFIKAAGGIGGSNTTQAWSSGNGKRIHSGVASLGGSRLAYEPTGPGATATGRSGTTAGEEI
jgi:hypothetical protein